MLILRDYSKRFNGRLILKIDSLTFGPGVHWIKGDNGSGKTTLFKSMSGILPFQGHISFSDGIDCFQHPVDFRKRISFSEAEPQYPGFLTAKDLIRFIGSVRGASLNQQQDYARVFGVDQYVDSPCETYSSGMIKKLGLMLAFLGASRVIILDEPLITLDEPSRQALLDQVTKKINEGLIFLISSHHSIASQGFPVDHTYLIENQTIHSL